MRVIKFIKQEVSGWKIWEVTWLLFACVVIVSLSMYWEDTILGIISATTGVVAVICTGKGKRSAYIFGIPNVILYTIISYNSRFYGEVMLNAFYFLPMQFYGFYIWTKYMDNHSGEVIKKRMTAKELALLILAVVLLSLLYGYFLSKLGGNLPYIDSFSTVTSIVAMIVSVKRFAEQWLLWIIVNVVTIIMWGYAFFVQGSESVATLVMWCVFLINAVIMYVKWIKDVKKQSRYDEV